MKITTTLISFILLLSLVQPVVMQVVQSKNISCVSGCCANNKSTKKEKENKKDCNPFLGCANTVWLSTPLDAGEVVTIKYSDKKFFLKNDNRLNKHWSKFFHPPNIEV